MNADEAQARMQEIQRIMERATLFTLLPGVPAVVGGLMVLAGCGVSYSMFHSLDFGDLLHVSPNSQTAFCLMWFLIGVGIVGVGLGPVPQLSAQNAKPRFTLKGHTDCVNSVAFSPDGKTLASGSPDRAFTRGVLGFA